MNKKSIIKDKTKIPKGPYCYDEKRKPCRYWRTLEDRPKQENGWCDYLEYGDWEINERKTVTDIFIKGRPKTNRKFSGHELGIPIGLLWDQCKECGINNGE